MSSIQHRQTPTGADRYRVIWRQDRAQKVLTFTDEPSATRWKALLDSAGPALALHALQQEKPPEDEPTVAQLVGHHIEHLTGIQDGTRSDYRSYLERDIRPHIGDLPCSLLTRDAGERWVNALTRLGLSGKSIKNRHALLSAAMARAMRDGVVHENPVKGLKLPTTRSDAEMVFLTREEYDRLRAVVPDRWRPLVMLLAESGLRWSEATALTVDDLDFHGRTIRVRQAWKHTNGAGHVLGTPKSRRSVRTVAMPLSIRGELLGLTEGRGPNEFVFTNSRGGPVRHSAFHEGVWTPAVRVLAGDAQTRVVTGKRGRPQIIWEKGHGKRPRIHDLRHTFASWAIQGGHSLTAIQRHMGHESITTTSDRYGHLRRADLDAFAELVPMSGVPALRG